MIGATPAQVTHISVIVALDATNVRNRNGTMACECNESRYATG